MAADRSKPKVRRPMALVIVLPTQGLPVEAGAIVDIRNDRRGYKGIEA